jgi:hypothetical protein
MSVSLRGCIFNFRFKKGFQILLSFLSDLLVANILVAWFVQFATIKIAHFKPSYIFAYIVSFLAMFIFSIVDILVAIANRSWGDGYTRSDSPFRDPSGMSLFYCF